MSWRWQDRDTWPARARGLLVCSWRGHRRRRKMIGAVCIRCSRFNPSWGPTDDDWFPKES